MKITTEDVRASKADLDYHYTTHHCEGFCEVEYKLWQRAEWFSQHWNQDISEDEFKLVNELELAA